jgi:hypothetical protein
MDVIATRCGSCGPHQEAIASQQEEKQMSLSTLANPSSRLAFSATRVRMEMRFDRLLEQHDRLYGVNWSIRIDDALEMATFCSFNRSHFPLQTGKGNGAIALKEVCDLADELKLHMYLWTLYEPLVEYYERFGFDQTIHSGCGMWRFIRRYKIAS